MGRRAAIPTVVALVLVGCGGAQGPSRAEAIRRAAAICEGAAIPGIPTDARAVPIPNRAVRMATLTVAQERREVERLRTIGSRDGEFRSALAVFEGALPQLDRFIREARAGRDGSAARARGAYDASIVEWQARAGAAGFDVCSRYGFAF